MTQAVAFHFTSPQFVFESGRVMFTKGARLFCDGQFHEGEIKDGIIDGVLVEGPIEFDAWLGDLIVVRSDDKRRYHVGPVTISSRLRPEDLRAGRVVVQLNLPVVLIVRVEDPDGQRVEDACVSLSLAGWIATMETRTDARGEVVLLVGAGRHSARVADDRGRRVSADVTITPADSGERELVLRVPTPENRPN